MHLELINRLIVLIEGLIKLPHDELSNSPLGLIQALEDDPVKASCFGMHWFLFGYFLSMLFRLYVVQIKRKKKVDERKCAFLVT